MIKLEGITKSFGSLQVLKGIDLAEPEKRLSYRSWERLTNRMRARWRLTER